MTDFSTLLKKIANNEKLTPQELDELGNFGTNTQQNNAFTAGLQNGTSSLYVNTITGRSSEFDYPQSGLSVKVARTTAQTISTGGGGMADCQFTSVVYSDAPFFNPSENTKITIPRRGRYLVFARAYWAPSAAAGTRQLNVVKNGGAGIGILNGQQNDSGASRAVLCFAYGEVTFEKDEYLSNSLAQFTGSDLNCTDSYLTVRLLRAGDEETTIGS